MKIGRASVVCGIICLNALFLIAGYLVWAKGTRLRFRNHDIPMFAVIVDPSGSSGLAVVKDWSDPPFGFSESTVSNIRWITHDDISNPETISIKDTGRYKNIILNWNKTNAKVSNSYIDIYDVKLIPGEDSHHFTVLVSVSSPFPYTLEYRILDNSVYRPRVGYPSASWMVLEGLLLLVFLMSNGVILIRLREVLTSDSM